MTTTNTETLRVAFRVDRRRGQSREVVAVLPDNDANPGKWVMYVHVGQHSEGARAWYYQCTRPARGR